MKRTDNQLASAKVILSTLLLITSATVAAVLLSGCDRASAPAQHSVVAMATSATSVASTTPIISPTLPPTLPATLPPLASPSPSSSPPPPPPPVDTFEAPTTTPAPILPTGTPAPLPRPPQATSLPLVTSTPGTATPGTPVLDTPTASAKAPGKAPGKPLDNQGVNIAWGVASDTGLTIWVGTYSDTPSPSIANSRAIVKWATPLTLLDMAVSPDHQSLAVLTYNAAESGEQGTPGWLSVINLNDNSVQNVPNYDNHYDLYSYFYSQSTTKMLGWIDNSTFMVQKSFGAAVAVGKDGASYSLVPFPQGGYQSEIALESALSSDRATIFSQLNGGDKSGFWLYGIDGSNPAQLLDGTTAKQLDTAQWSPDAKYISFIAPQAEGGGITDQYLGIWLLDVAAKTQNAISGENTWDVDPAWSSDSSKIAFLRSDEPNADDLAHYYNPEKLNTNIFFAGVSDLTPHQLTKFQGTNNSDLEWTDGGNLVLASTSGSSNPGTELPNLIAVSGKDGTVTTLVSGSSNEAIEHPTLFR